MRRSCSESLKGGEPAAERREAVPYQHRQPQQDAESDVTISQAACCGKFARVCGARQAWQKEGRTGGRTGC